MNKDLQLIKLVKKIRACHGCELHLPFKPRPIIQTGISSEIVIIGQAPGIRVQNSGIPWDDHSGDRLRNWLSLSKEIFYDESLITIMPMGFCYPGVDKNGGDKPPRSECAPLWHPPLRNLLSHVKLTLLVGSYAQRYYLGEKQKPTMSENIHSWREYLPNFIPLPHPSWRNTGWLKNNPWFEIELLPYLRKEINKIIKFS